MLGGRSGQASAMRGKGIRLRHGLTLWLGVNVAVRLWGGRFRAAAIVAVPLVAQDFRRRLTLRVFISLPTVKKGVEH